MKNMNKTILIAALLITFLKGYSSELVSLNGSIIHLDSGNLEVYDGLYNKSKIPLKLTSGGLNLPNKIGQTYSVKVKLNSEDLDKKYVLYSPISIFDSVTFYELVGGNLNLLGYSGREVNKLKRLINDPYPSIYLKFTENPTKEIIIHFKSSNQYVIPILIANETEYQSVVLNRNILFGAFVGIMICMFLYNLILFSLTKDWNYTYYLPYMLGVMFAQIGILGADDILLSQGHTSNLFIYIGSSVGGVFGALFAKRFLNLNTKPKWMNYIINVGILLYILVTIFFLLDYLNFGYQLIQIAGLISVLGLLVVSIKLAVQGDKRAVQYLYAWTILLISLVFYFLKDIGIIDPTNFSTFAFAIGVVLEIVLLSLVLANQINVYKKQKEEANQRAIFEIRKNEELVVNQNILLEKKVKERTAELEEALRDLKATQSRLVQSEKMASLGVLTAGIAHEINNPINFVSANVIPLKENIEILTKLLAEYKNIDSASPKQELERILAMEQDLEIDYLLKETDMLIDGIEEGAKRTHTIVDGLKTFSRGDGFDESLADINNGIKSTLSVLKSKLKGINMVLNLSKLPLVNCQTGKLNQVFLNLINNAVDALEEKHGANSNNSTIEIITILNENNLVEISIRDNANGISDDLKEKLFEPFFTTKAIGKGTGLGLAISYGIIEEHKGTIDFESELGKGTTFTVILPLAKS
jgi:two-component system NtrC family sensor kinase